MTYAGLMIMALGFLVMTFGGVPEVRRRTRGIYYGWWVLTATFVLGAVSGGIFSFSNGIFFDPIRRDLALSSAETSLIFSLARAEGSIAGPMVGYLVDRFGSRPLIIVGGIMASLGFVALRWVDSYWLFLIIFVGVVSTGKSAGLGQTLLGAVNRWFIARRSLAMSICITGFSSGGAVLLPLITIGVHTLGWRDVMFFSGIFMGVIVVPLAMVIRHSPESMGIEPDLEPDRGDRLQSNSASTAGTYDFTVGEALRTKTFWVFLVATVMRITLWGALSVHAVEMMAWKGMDREAAGLMFSLMFFLSIPARLVAGILGVRMPLQPMMCVGMVSAALASLALLVLPTNLAVVIFVVLMAVEQGGSTLNWVALGNYFGRKSFSTLMGIMSTCFNIGMLISPIYAGWVFDQTESYAIVLSTFIPIYGLSAFLYLIMRQPTPPSRPALAVQPTT